MELGSQVKKALEGLTQSSSQEKISVISHEIDQFKEIELDEIEIEEALRAGREKKFYLQKWISYNKSLTDEYIPPKFTADELLQDFKAKWDVDIENEEVVQKLCWYFSDDEKFDGNLKKGILLFGGIGVGKTELMEFFMKNQKASYRIVTCKSIEEEYASGGIPAIRGYYNNMPVAKNSDRFLHQFVGYCFDDLGVDEDVKNFGNKKNAMADIVQARYNNKIDYKYTHMTTNLSAPEIEKGYGDRASNRMVQMFNMIKFPSTAKSRRK